MIKFDSDSDGDGMRKRAFSILGLFWGKLDAITSSIINIMSLQMKADTEWSDSKAEV